MEAAIAQHRRELDDILALHGGRTVNQYAEHLVSQVRDVKFTHGERDALLASFKALGQSVADPYNIILIAYILAVALQLFFLSRSALLNRWSNAFFSSKQALTYALLAIVSLASTWYYMFAYLFASYASFLERQHLAGLEVPTLPKCEVPTFSCLVDVVTTRTLRTSTWLRQTSLFKEAWLSVVRQPLHWAWSIEVCLFCVTTFALYITNKGPSNRIPYGAVYMLLGQSCAISVAYNLFNLALCVREDATASGRPSRRSKRSDSFTMPPPSSAHPLESSSSHNGSFWSVSVRLLLLAIGLYFVFQVPGDMGSLLWMHAAPLMLTLPALKANERKDTTSMSTIYAAVGIISFILRTRVLLHSRDGLRNLIDILFENPAQSSISFDAICLQVSVMAQLAFAKRWMLVALTPVIGSTASLAFHLALQGRRLSESLTRLNSPSVRKRADEARHSRSTSVKRSPSKVTSRRPSSKNADTSDSESASVKTKTTRRTQKTASIRRRKSGAERGAEGMGTSSEKEEKTDLSDATLIADTPAARAKRSRPRPRNQDALDGLELPSEASGIAETLSKGRAPGMGISASTGGARPRGRPKKAG